VICHTSITIPANIRKRVALIATDDDDLLVKDRRRWEESALRSHFRRVCRKLSGTERESIRTLNPGRPDYDFVEAIADLARLPDRKANRFREQWDESDRHDEELPAHEVAPSVTSETRIARR